tara:strand:+ start:179 stop:451 length:273 start_codon:yes stop_codon:yes gene_type:complete
MKNKKTLSKHDLLRGIKSLAMEIQMLQRHVMLMDDVLDKYIQLNKDENKLKKFMEKLNKLEKSKLNKRKENNELQHSERKQSRRDSTISK